MARRHIRKMRGGAQSHLVEADDGRFYIVKFQNNPQHRRILVNELVASTFLKYLEISTAETALIHVTADFLRENPDVSIELGASKTPVAMGWQFGSPTRAIRQESRSTISCPTHCFTKCATWRIF